MFCTKCGANLPEGAAFCTNCGNQMTAPSQPAPEPQQPQYQPPQYQQPVYQPQPPVYPAPVSKKEYVKTLAPKAVKSQASLVLITFLISLALLAGSIVAPLTVSVFDIPAVSFALSVVGEMEGEDMDPDDLIDELEASYDEAYESYEMQKEFLDKDERNAMKNTLDAMEKMIDNLSILNVQDALSTLEKEGGDYMDESTLEEISMINQVMTILIASIVGAFLLPLLFTLLGGLKKSTGLTITALIFTVMSQLSLSGMLWVILSAVVLIVQAVLCSKIGKAYQNYRVGRA